LLVQIVVLLEILKLEIMKLTSQFSTDGTTIYVTRRYQGRRPNLPESLHHLTREQMALPHWAKAIRIEYDHIYQFCQER
jgi:hypothetical protein